MEAPDGQDAKGDSAENEATCVSNDDSSPDKSERQRVLKDVGLTSTSFIGPAFPPNKVEPDIEDTLSEFYKELEEIGAPDSADENSGKRDPGFDQSLTPSGISQSLSQPATRNKTDVPDGGKEKSCESPVTEFHLKGSEQKQPRWPHWYQNVPYHHRRPRPDVQPERDGTTPDHWYHPQSTDRPRPPNPRFHRPPFHRPPPPSAFPYPQNPPSHIRHNWGRSVMPNYHQEEARFPTFSRIPPPDFHPSTSPHIDSERYFDWQREGYHSDAHSGNFSVGWVQDRNEERYQFDEEHDRLLRYGAGYGAAYDQWDRRCPPAENNNSALVLILMRGLPGSGKSTLARELLFTGPSGLILSTDDYFSCTDGYRYELDRLGAAHEWNQSRAKNAMQDGRSPVIIDNTNLQAWEMKPYVKMALESGYRVDFCEPDTSWKFDPYELERRNKHGVPQEKIAQMLDRFSFPISVDIVMNSQEPPHVSKQRRADQPHVMRRNQDYH